MDVGNNDVSGGAIMNICACFEFGQVGAIFGDENPPLAIEAVRIADIEFTPYIFPDCKIRGDDKNAALCNTKGRQSHQARLAATNRELDIARLVAMLEVVTNREIAIDLRFT